MNYNSYNVQYPNYIPAYTSTITCNLCKGTGYYILDGIQNVCQCMNQTKLVQPQNINVLVNEKKPGLIRRTFQALSDCVQCGGRGFINGFRHPNHTKYCYTCIKSNGFCPKCNNTGYKLSSGKICKCGTLPVS
jgi:hypothetical protein